ncbi:MAG TPA: hypothetical protein VEP90_10005 [Methylomirabilota bacterium]|nr:hypothetical protein [Methylomirabilota bacterium]
MFISVQSSLIGFHNPKKHRGLTDREFLEAWKLAKKENKNPQQQKYYDFLLDNEYYFLSFIRSTLFRRKRVL